MGLPEHLIYENTLTIESALASDEGLYICNGIIDERTLIRCEIIVLVAGK